MRSVLALLACAASVFGYEVLFPGGGDSYWTDNGPQIVRWSRVNTDRDNFTIFLVNDEDPTILQNNTQGLIALVNGADGNATVNPPSGGWPTGTGFRVNLCQDSDHPNSILAQSEKFEIRASNETSTPSTITRPTTSIRQTPQGTNTGAGQASQTDNLPPIIDNDGAASASVYNAGLLAVLALAGLALA